MLGFNTPIPSPKLHPVRDHRPSRGPLGCRGQICLPPPASSFSWLTGIFWDGVLITGEREWCERGHSWRSTHPNACPSGKTTAGDDMSRICNSSDQLIAKMFAIINIKSCAVRLHIPDICSSSSSSSAALSWCLFISKLSAWSRFTTALCCVHTHQGKDGNTQFWSSQKQQEESKEGLKTAHLFCDVPTTSCSFFFYRQILEASATGVKIRSQWEAAEVSSYLCALKSTELLWSQRKCLQPFFTSLCENQL